MSGLVFHGTTGKFTWRMLATVLGGQSLCVFFGALVARAIAASGQSGGSPTAYLVVGCGLAVLCVLAAATMRRPWGVTFGWLVQALTLLSSVVLPMMLVVGLIFLALWVTCLVQGARVDRLQAESAAAAAPTEGGQPPGPGR